MPLSRTPGTFADQDSTARSISILEGRLGLPYGMPTEVVRSDRNVRFGELAIVDPTDGALTLTLPGGSVSDMGRLVCFTNRTSSTNTITVQTRAGLIEGAVSQAIGAAWSARAFVFVGQDSSGDIWLMLEL